MRKTPTVNLPFIISLFNCGNKFHGIKTTHTKTHKHTSFHTFSHPHNSVTKQILISIFLKPTNHVVFKTTSYSLHSFSGGRNKYKVADWCFIFPFSKCRLQLMMSKNPSGNNTKSRKIKPQLHVVLSSRGRTSSLVFFNLGVLHCWPWLIPLNTPIKMTKPWSKPMTGPWVYLTTESFTVQGLNIHVGQTGHRTLSHGTNRLKATRKDLPESKWHWS